MPCTSSSLEFRFKVISRLVNAFVLLFFNFSAIWSADEGREMCWQLDPTEGPSRVRRRLIRVPRTTEEKHILPEAQKKTSKRVGKFSSPNHKMTLW